MPWDHSRYLGIWGEAEELAQSVKFLWCKREVLSSDPSTHLMTECGHKLLQSHCWMIEAGASLDLTGELTQSSW